jgi:hypothetical protein
LKATLTSGPRPSVRVRERERERGVAGRLGANGPQCFVGWELGWAARVKKKRAGWAGKREG